jgi:hypothetical protein
MQSNEYLDTPLAAATLRLSQSTLSKWRLTGDGPKYLNMEGACCTRATPWRRGQRGMSAPPRALLKVLRVRPGTLSRIA